MFPRGVFLLDVPRVRDGAGRRGDEVSNELGFLLSLLVLWSGGFCVGLSVGLKLRQATGEAK